MSRLPMTKHHYVSVERQVNKPLPTSPTVYCSACKEREVILYLLHLLVPLLLENIIKIPVADLNQLYCTFK